MENCGVAALEVDFDVSSLEHVVRDITMMFGSKTHAPKRHREQDDVVSFVCRCVCVGVVCVCVPVVCTPPLYSVATQTLTQSR